MVSIFIFRRDLRLNDNTGLNEALTQDKVIPIFILDPRQVDDNEYKSEFALSFMINSLIDLNKELKNKNGELNIFYGLPEIVLENIYKKIKFDSIYVNEDYTPFSLARDKKIKEFCDKNGIEFQSYSDYLLFENKEMFNFKTFSSFYKFAKNFPVRKPATVENEFIKIDNLKINFILKYKNRESFLKGGRAEAIYLMKRNFDYSKRNYLGEESTSHLSPHIKFGNVSIREVFYTFYDNEDFIRQLYWRDFYTLIAYKFPFVFERNFKDMEIKWENNEILFNAWKEGRTGYPIVDAGMRELNETGYMHNRARLITSFFLTKVLFISWKLGEKYFANHLVDYDPSINNGNWQWVASTGTDYMFRIFNPWLQQKKYDENCSYIKKWINELKEYNCEIIHNAYNYDLKNYPRPIIDWKERIKLAKKIYYNSAL